MKKRPKVEDSNLKKNRFILNTIIYNLTLHQLKNDKIVDSLIGLKESADEVITFIIIKIVFKLRII